MTRRKLIDEKKFRQEKSVIGSEGGSFVGQPISSTSGKVRRPSTFPSWKARAGSLSSLSGTARGSSLRSFMGGGAASSSSLSSSGSSSMGAFLLLLLQNAKKLAWVSDYT